MFANRDARQPPAQTPAKAPEILSDSSTIFVTTRKVYVAEPGSRLRTLKCILCREPVAGLEFLVRQLVSTDIYQRGYDHVATIAAVTHTCHGEVSDDEIAQAMADAVRTEMTG